MSGRAAASRKAWDSRKRQQAARLQAALAGGPPLMAADEIEALRGTQAARTMPGASITELLARIRARQEAEVG